MQNNYLPKPELQSKDLKVAFYKIKKFWLILIIFALLALVIFFAFVRRDTKQSNSSNVNSSIPSKQSSKNKDYIRLIATGDTIAHDALNAQAKNSDGSYDYYQFIKPMQPYFDTSDVNFCNQAVPGGGTKFGISGYPVFNSPLEVARDLNNLGCNVINTGTNHTFDRGQDVIDAELNYWDTLPGMLAVAGANRNQKEQDTIRYFSINGVKFAFLSYSTYSNITPPNTYGLNMYEAGKAESQVKDARQNSDIVIVSMRWGTEYSQDINAEQERISQKLSDWGSDIIIGHGPHVLEPVKILESRDGRKTLCWYSLGNFLNAQVPPESLINGLAIMDIDIATKKVKQPSFMPIYMHYEWTAEQKANEDLLKRKNFTLVPLDQSKDLLSRSQNNTTIEAQTRRITNTLNTYTTVSIVSSEAITRR